MSSSAPNLGLPASQEKPLAQLVLIRPISRKLFKLRSKTCEQSTLTSTTNTVSTRKYLSSSSSRPFAQLLSPGLFAGWDSQTVVLTLSGVRRRSRILVKKSSPFRWSIAHSRLMRRGMGCRTPVKSLVYLWWHIVLLDVGWLVEGNAVFSTVKRFLFLTL